MLRIYTYRVESSMCNDRGFEQLIVNRHILLHFIFYEISGGWIFPLTFI